MTRRRWYGRGPTSLPAEAAARARGDAAIEAGLLGTYEQIVDHDADLLLKAGFSALARSRRRSAALLKAVPIANRSTWYQQGYASAAILSANYRTRRQVLVAAGGIRVVYGNASINESAAPPATITVRCALELPSGTKYPLHFNGKRDVVIEPYGVVVSDPLAVEVAVVDLCFIRTFVSASAGAWPLGDSNRYTGEGGDTATNAVDQTLTGTISTSSTFHYGPMAVLGVPADPDPVVVAGVGDSIVFGQGDSPALGAVVAGSGFFERAMNNATLSFKVASSGETAAGFIAGHRVRGAVIAGATHALCEYGVNDMLGASPLATVQANLIAIWRLLALQGLLVSQTTTTPVATSTEGWFTEASQTPNASVQAVRPSVNVWLRAGAPLNPTTFAPMTVGAVGSIVAGATGHPLASIIDLAATVEGAVSGTWKQPADGRTVTDATTTASTLLTSVTADFTDADLDRMVKIPGAGPAGATYYGTIYQIFAVSDQVRVTPAMSTVLSNATVTIGTVMTADGTHPSIAGHKAMAAAVPTFTLPA